MVLAELTFKIIYQYEDDVPEDLAAALAAQPELQAKFDGMAFTHRKEYARWWPTPSARRRGSAAWPKRSR